MFSLIKLVGDICPQQVVQLLGVEATSKIDILERCYISKTEREFYSKQKEEDVNDSDNKVKFALIKYKRDGKYIEEILENERIR